MNKFSITLTDKDKIDLDVTSSTTPEITKVCAQAIKEFAAVQTVGKDVDPALLKQTIVDIFKKELYK